LFEVNNFELGGQTGEGDGIGVAVFLTTFFFFFTGFLVTFLVVVGLGVAFTVLLTVGFGVALAVGFGVGVAAEANEVTITADIKVAINNLIFTLCSS
jgi:hypothetical protein